MDFPKCDCFLKVEKARFRYRAAAIIIEDGCVLMAGNCLEDNYYSVGGAVMMGETAEDAVRREVFEETGVHYEIDRLALIHENFFSDATGTQAGLSNHELCLYFLMKPRGTRELGTLGTVNGVLETMHWLPVSELKNQKLFPTFYKDYLPDLPSGVTHIVTVE